VPRSLPGDFHAIGPARGKLVQSAVLATICLMPGYPGIRLCFHIELPAEAPARIWATASSPAAPSMLRMEATAAGAEQISILGVATINPALANMSPTLAARMGFTFTRINSTTILLQGSVK